MSYRSWHPWGSCDCKLCCNEPRSLHLATLCIPNQQPDQWYSQDLQKEELSRLPTTTSSANTLATAALPVKSGPAGQAIPPSHHGTCVVVQDCISAEADGAAVVGVGAVARPKTHRPHALHPHSATSGAGSFGARDALNQEISVGIVQIIEVCDIYGKGLRTLAAKQLVQSQCASERLRCKSRML
jgi:hypothetical protein